MAKPTTKELTDAVSAVLKDQLSALANGAAADVRAYAQAIAGELISASADGRAEVTEELMDQLKLLAEKHRITLVNRGWATLSKVADVLLGMAVRLIA